MVKVTERYLARRAGLEILGFKVSGGTRTMKTSTGIVRILCTNAGPDYNYVMPSNPPEGYPIVPAYHNHPSTPIPVANLMADGAIRFVNGDRGSQVVDYQNLIRSVFGSLP